MKAGCKVIVCADNSSYPRRFFALRRKHMRMRESYDIMLVAGPYSQPLVPLAKKCRKGPVVMDYFLGFTETLVEDRKVTPPNSFSAYLYRLLDRLAPKFADLIISDTNSHIDYFCETFHLNRERFKRIFVGSDEEFFYPRPRKVEKNYFKVLFWGNFIPLHGISYIIKAAKLLEHHKEIVFEIRGSGQTYHKIRKLSQSLNIHNVDFTPPVPYEKLPDCISTADVCLGVFGQNQKAKRVIPQKIFEAIAMKKPVITGDSPAIREALLPGTDCITCTMADERAIADSIILLKEDSNLREKIAYNSYAVFRRNYTMSTLGRQLVDSFKEIIEC